MYRRKTALLTARISHINALRIFFVILVLWCELGLFLWSVSNCQWPGPVSALRVLLVADPQVLDHRSYPDRPQVLARLTQFVVDFNLRKSWSVVSKFYPNVIIFLGDMTDGGRFAMRRNEYGEYVARFRHIFCPVENASVYFLPGNHDVGLGAAKQFSPFAQERFEEHFGPLNQVIEMNGRLVVFIDSPGLVDEDYRRMAARVDFDTWKGDSDSVVDFVKRVALEKEGRETVLLSHIPLDRPEGSDCGPLRERGTLRRGAGFGYQNLLGKDTTAFLLKNLRPKLVFSGDDHDYCAYAHRVPGQEEGVLEITVRSFSMVMGVQRPGFQLLSIPPRESNEPMQHVPCLLPNQLRIYTHVYGPIIVLALAYLLYSRIRGRRHSLPPLSLGGLRDRQLPAPEWSAFTESPTPHESEETPMSAFEAPPLSSRSMLTATLMPRSEGSSPIGSPFLRPMNELPTSRAGYAFAFNSNEDFDGHDSASYIPKSANPELQPPKSAARSGGWINTWRRQERQRRQRWRPWQQVLKSYRKLSTSVRRRSSGWYARFADDVARVAWPPMLVYCAIIILTFW